jgi:hypothetical protein
MRSRPATPTASCVDSCSALSPLGGGMTALARQRSKGVPHLPKPVADYDGKINHLAITFAQPLRWPAAPSCSEEQMGEEAATPGQPVRACARFRRSSGNSPSRITGCRWLCRNHSASSGTLTFRCIHSRPDCPASQYKKVPSLCRNCGP